MYLLCQVRPIKVTPDEPDQELSCFAFVAFLPAPLRKLGIKLRAPVMMQLFTTVRTQDLSTLCSYLLLSLIPLPKDTERRCIRALLCSGLRVRSIASLSLPIVLPVVLSPVRLMVSVNTHNESLAMNVHTIIAWYISQWLAEDMGQQLKSQQVQQPDCQHSLHTICPPRLPVYSTCAQDKTMVQLLLRRASHITCLPVGLQLCAFFHQLLHQ